ncbi:MAG: hypothetical protein RBU37_10535 [Myxococcota bacterium]|nr:hypothetical protein [Myxococcota bacterium]
MKPLMIALLLPMLLWACDDEPETVDASVEQELPGDDADAVPDEQSEQDAPDETQTDTDIDADAPEADEPEADESEADESEEPEADEDVDTTPVTSCDELDAQPCLTNLDCSADSRCQSFSDTLELRCCVEGARGTAELGQSCESELDCDFGRCLERDDGARFCSGACAGDLDCPSSMFCSDFFSWCVPKDAGAPPESCSELGLDQCFYNENCEEQDRCEDVIDGELELLCCKPGVRGSGAVGDACSSGNDCSFGRCFDGLCSEYCDFDDELCPQPLMECNYITGYCERS